MPLEKYKISHAGKSVVLDAYCAQEARELGARQMGVAVPAGKHPIKWVRNNFEAVVVEAAPPPRDPNVAPTVFRGNPVLAAIKHGSPRFAPTWYVVVKGASFFEAYNPQGHLCGIGETLEQATLVARRESGSMFDEHKSSLDFGH